MLKRQRSNSDFLGGYKDKDNNKDNNNIDELDTKIDVSRFII